MTISGIPTQDKCSEEPDEFAAWAFVAMPSGPKDVPLLVHPSTLQVWSQHLHDCGFRFHPDLQQKWYKAPSVDNPYAMMNGDWVDEKPAEKPAESVLQGVVDNMTDDQKDELRRLLDTKEG